LVLAATATKGTASFILMTPFRIVAHKGEHRQSGAFLPVSAEGLEGQLSDIGFAAGYDWDEAQSRRTKKAA